MPEQNVISLLEAGIKAEGLRQKTIASNIANAETPGYKRLDVKFEEALTKAMDSSGEVDLNEFEPEIYHPDDPALKANGNNVSMESEIGDLVRTSLRYTTYIRLLRKKFAQIETAMGGRT